MTVDVALGVDIGTSGVRIAAVDGSNAVRAMATAPIPAPLNMDGRIRQDPALWWEAMQAAFLGLRLEGLRPRAVAIDGTSGTIVAADHDGAAVGFASMYNDPCGKAELAGIAAVAPRETAALGGTSPLARAMEIAGGAPRVLHQADWIMGRLTGHYDVTDENNALKSGYDPVSRQWPGWIAEAGFDPVRFPGVVPAGTRVAAIARHVARQLGLPDDVAVVAGTTDGCAAFLASGASESGDGVTSLGSTLTIKLLTRAPVFAPEFGIYSHRIAGHWLAGGASNSGGAVLAKYFTPEDLARLTPLIDPARPTGLDYYPLAKPGERFPVNDPDLPPRLEPRPADDHLFLQAMLEGIARVEAGGYARLAELGASPLASLRTVGGGAANSGWTAIRLKVLGVPARPPLSEHAAVGTALLAWRGISHAD